MSRPGSDASGAAQGGAAARAGAGRRVVVRRPPRADTAAVERLAAAGVATVAEAAGRRGIADPGLRPVVDGCRVAGPAVTALCHPGDNLMVHAAVEQCEPGDVLVVAVTAACTDAMVGELLATSLRARGVAAAVVDAGVRDVADLRAMAFPTWSRAVSPHGTVKATPGAVNVPVVCAGAPVGPGDVVVADDDGVVCVPAGEAPAVADAAEARAAREQAVRERLAAGELGLDLYGLRERLAELGVAHVDADEGEA